MNGEQEFVFTEGSVFITTEGEKYVSGYQCVIKTMLAVTALLSRLRVTSVDLDGDIVTSTVTRKIVDGDLPYHRPCSQNYVI
ncbi:hypothetical protein O9992_01115 [Vibrio lentus]|nr:hypothetical protein [Vibrio lentus]